MGQQQLEQHNNITVMNMPDNSNSKSRMRINDEEGNTRIEYHVGMGGGATAEGGSSKHIRRMSTTDVPSTRSKSKSSSKKKEGSSSKTTENRRSKLSRGLSVGVLRGGDNQNSLPPSTRKTRDDFKRSKPNRRMSTGTQKTTSSSSLSKSKSRKSVAPIGTTSGSKEESKPQEEIPNGSLSKSSRGERSSLTRRKSSKKDGFRKIESENALTTKSKSKKDAKEKEERSELTRRKSTSVVRSGDKSTKSSLTRRKSKRESRVKKTEDGAGGPEKPSKEQSLTTKRKSKRAISPKKSKEEKQESVTNKTKRAISPKKGKHGEIKKEFLALVQGGEMNNEVGDTINPRLKPSRRMSMGVQSTVPATKNIKKEGGGGGGNLAAFIQPRGVRPGRRMSTGSIMSSGSRITVSKPFNPTVPNLWISDNIFNPPQNKKKALKAEKASANEAVEELVDTIEAIKRSSQAADAVLQAFKFKPQTLEANMACAAQQGQLVDLMEQQVQREMGQVYDDISLQPEYNVRDHIVSRGSGDGNKSSAAVPARKKIAHYKDTPTAPANAWMLDKFLESDHTDTTISNERDEEMESIARAIRKSSQAAKEVMEVFESQPQNLLLDVAHALKKGEHVEIERHQVQRQLEQEKDALNQHEQRLKLEQSRLEASMSFIGNFKGRNMNLSNQASSDGNSSKKHLDLYRDESSKALTKKKGRKASRRLTAAT